MANLAELFSKSGMCKEILYNIRSDRYPILYKCRFLDPKTIKYVIGPNCYYRYKLFGRTFCFFGEFHESHLNLNIGIPKDANRTNTVLFPSYVHSLANANSDTKYDLFFENAGTLPSESATLDAISYEFDNCIAKSPACEYKNLRIHSVNYRLSPDVSAVLEELKARTVRPQLEEMLDILLRFLDFERVKKQFGAITDLHFKHNLREYMVHQITNYVQKYYTHPKPNFTELTFNIMDVYALPRIFRDFDNTIRKPKYPSPYYGTSDTVIYYAGREHIFNIVHFLNIMNVTLLSKYENEANTPWIKC